MLTPLHLACTYGQTSTARILLENNADIQCAGEKGQTSLHKACAVGNIALVEMITWSAKMAGESKVLNNVSRVYGYRDIVGQPDILLHRTYRC